MASATLDAVGERSGREMAKSRTYGLLLPGRKWPFAHPCTPASCRSRSRGSAAFGCALVLRGPIAGPSTGGLEFLHLPHCRSLQPQVGFENSYLEKIITEITQIAWKASLASESTVPKVWPPETKVLLSSDFLNLRVLDLAVRIACAAKVLLEDTAAVEGRRCREFCDVTG